MSLALVAKDLGRTNATTYWRARKLGLPSGAPEQSEYLTHAARRAGFGTGQLRRILRDIGAPIQTTMARPTKAKRHFHAVDPIDVDDAVAAWASQETPENAARRHGVTGETVRSALLAAGHRPPKEKKARWRLSSSLIDAALKTYRPGLSVRAHALRVGLCRTTLANKLRAKGILGEKRPGVEIRLSIEQVDVALGR